ncbi:MAG TPA: FAD-dependent monooxygenase, partial [Parafilimonas sp.]
MQKNISLKLLPHQAADNTAISDCIIKFLAIKTANLNGFNFIKKSVDARSKQPWINVTVKAFIKEPYTGYSFNNIVFKDVRHAKNSVLIIGAGPAGLFAALKFLQHGIKPILLERGKDIRLRRRDLAILNKEGIINSESNYCFGEGGAGTYSDGKLYTRSNKRGSVHDILNLFVQFGADENILYESHPHIGTNKLPQIITAMRKQIEDCGGKILFGKKLIDFIISNNKI